MIESLNTGNLQRLSAELAAGRIDTLLRIGQTVSAQVVSVTPVLPATKTVTASSKNEAGTSAQNRADAPAVNRNLAASGSASSASTPTPQPSSTTREQPPANPQLNQAGYRAKLNVQGRLLEIITPRPLTQGAEIQISRDQGNRLTIISTAAGSNTANSAARTGGQAAAAPAAGSSPGGSSPAPAPTNANNNIPALRENSRAALTELSQWLRPGERVQATVLQSRAIATNTAPVQQGTDTTGYRVSVEAQGRTLELVSPRPLPVGSEVRLRHDRNGQLRVEVPAGKSQAVEQSLRQHLPQQQLPTQLLNLLADNQNVVQISRAQPMLQSLIQLLLGRSLSTPQQANSDGVKQQLQTAGVQLEGQLARGQTQQLQLDQKALLLRFQQALSASGQANTSDSENALHQRLTQLTQGSLSRVFFNQLTSLFQHQQDASPEANRHIALDMPVLWQGRNENIHLRISGDDESNPSESGDHQRSWHVQLRFSLEDLPDMGADLRLQQESISIIWYGERRIRELLEPNFALLQQRLELLGLEVTDLSIREQQPPQPAGPAPKQRLIETKA